MPAREKGEFYKKDRKVLRFFCKYKDSRLQGDKRDYILYYYLLNDTIEIKEVGRVYTRSPLVVSYFISQTCTDDELPAHRTDRTPNIGEAGVGMGATKSIS